MTSIKFSDDDHKRVLDEIEKNKLARMEEETKRNQKIAEALKTFEPLSRRINFTEDTNGKQQQQEEPLDLADELIKKFKFKTVKTSEQIYRYDSQKGVYLNDGEILIKSELEARYVKEKEEFNKSMILLSQSDRGNGLVLPQPWSKKKIDEIIGQIERRTYIDITELDGDIEWLACADCMLNLKTGETAPFDPKYLNTTQIPVKYNLTVRNYIADLWYYCAQDPIVNSCPCPAVMKFLDEVMAPEDVEILLDFMAYCLWRYYKFHNWLLLNGAGQNGKSTLLKLIARFFGQQNVSSTSLRGLLYGKFASAGLYQKLVNIDADLSGDILQNTGELKKLTGSDEITAEFKYGQPFKFRNYAKPIFSCNEIPETTDKTDAFLRRLIIVNFKQQFFGNKEDPNLIDKLTNEEELSGLLYELLRRLPGVLEKGIRQTTDETMSQTYEKYVRGSNPVKYFAETALTTGDEIIPKPELYNNSYCWFCKVNKLAPESEQSFNRKLKAEGYQYKLFRMENGSREYCWYGIKLVDWKVLEDKEQETLEDLTALSPLEREAMK